MTDRILTVKQPWADEIMSGRKPIENRTWGTSYRGRLWIHASLRVDSRAPFDVDGLPLGVILGSVELIDVILDSTSDWAEPGCYHWVLANPHPCRPRPHRGGLGLRHYVPSRR